MIYDNYYFFPFIDILPTNKYNTPTIYSLLESIVNYGKDDKKKIKDLAKYGRQEIFDFDYPLTNNISKETFECNILNKFITRRIGFETVTLFKIQLNVKLNEIMPKYNKLFDSLENWNILEDGETLTKTGNNLNNVDTSSVLKNTSNNNTENISDRRNSNMPQNELEDIRNGNYITDYNYDTNTTNSNDISNSSGSSSSQNKNEYQEIIKRTPQNKTEIYIEMQNEINNIYSLIYKELDCLFYQLV